MNQQHDYIQGMQRKVGWFMLLGIGVLLLILLVMGVRSNFFAAKFYVFVQPPTAIAFYEGQVVRFQGFAIGDVDAIALLEQGKVQITLQLLDQYRVMLHEGAMVQLAKEGMIGKQFLRITAGNLEADILQDQMLLDYESEASIEQILEDIKPTIAQAENLLGELTKLTVWLNDPQGDVRLAVHNFSAFSSGLRSDDVLKISQETGRLLKNMRQVVGEAKREHMVTKLSHTLEATTTTLNEIQPFMHDLGQKGGESLEKMDILLLKMQRLTDNLNVVSSDVSELTPELPGLARELRESVSESRLLMRNLRKSWLLGGSDDTDAAYQGDYRSPSAVGFRP